MMKYLSLFFMLVVFSCGNRSAIELPEITSSTIQIEGKSSFASIYYNEETKDSTELDSDDFDLDKDFQIKVDKRLKLRQVIPIIQELTDKESDNQIEEIRTKRYFTCNQTSSRKDGYVDFSEVNYHFGIDKNIVENHNLYNVSQFAGTNYILSILFEENDSVTINSANFSKTEYLNQLKLTDSIQSQIMGIVYLKFNENLSFQEYITYKNQLSKIKLKHATISNDEYIFH